jgi:hypothetical protein
VTAHAVIIALTAAANYFGNKYLEDYALRHSRALRDVCGCTRAGAAWQVGIWRRRGEAGLYAFWKRTLAS